ncbi:MAG TPA: phage holin family protein [Dermatophilaceae bacterium]|nr:phage holin family protein [Dermatophilaceae bacterium]
MRSLVVKIVVNAAALWVAALVVPGIHIGQGAQWTATFTTVVLVALLFGVVNALIKPVVHFFATPFIWLTLGLFTIVVNALMLQLTSWLSGNLGLAFHVDSFFWSAVLGALLISVVSMVLHGVIPEKSRNRD